MTPPHLLKADLRRLALTARAALAAAAPNAGAAVAQRVLALLGRLPPRINIACYAPIGSELNSGPVMGALTAAGAQIVLPVTAGQGVRLLFRAWRPGDPLETGPFGTLHPGPGAPAAEPEIILAPLLAFDRSGHRLGYGAGYYDRTLAAMRAGMPVRAIGIGFDGQEVDAIPADPSDQRLDAVVTDARTIVISNAFPKTD